MVVVDGISHGIRSVPVLKRLAYRLGRLLFDYETKTKQNEAVRDNLYLCQSMLESQQRPLLLISPDYLVPHPLTFELVPQGMSPGSFMVFASRVHRIACQLRCRDGLLQTSIREVWMPNGRRRIVFAYRNRWSKTWSIHLPNGDKAGQLAPVPGRHLAVLASNEVVSIQTGCSCGRQCLSISRGGLGQTGKVIALAVPRAEEGGFMLVIAPYVDVVAMLIISSCIWKV